MADQDQAPVETEKPLDNFCPPEVAKKLAAVMGKVGNIPKNGRNDHFGYDYVLETDVVEYVRKWCAEEGLIVMANVVNTSREGNLSTVTLDLDWIDCDTGKLYRRRFVGTATDKQDKGVYKAYAGAFKYGLMKSLMISTGDDDPETGNEPRRSASKSRNQSSGSKNKQQSKSKPKTAKQWSQDVRDAASKLVKAGKITGDQVPAIIRHCIGSTQPQSIADCQKIINYLRDLWTGAEDWPPADQSQGDNLPDPADFDEDDFEFTDDDVPF